MTRRYAKSAIALLALLTLAPLFGCASSRGTLDFVPPQSSNLGQGPLVRIGSVVDARMFQLNPSDPSIPSLKGGEIEDQSITSRAIARKRNGYGKAMGDILLPEERTVAELARAAVERGLREGGYRVVAEGDPGFADATPVDVEVRKLWMWFTPGFFAAHLEFRAAIALKGSIGPLESTPEVPGYIRLATQAATTGAWTNTLRQGLENFNANLVDLLQGKPPAETSETGAP